LWFFDRRGEKKMKKYDLEKRTTEFGIEVIRFCKKVPRGIITDPLIRQLVRAGTSVGANYAEADDADSKNDFRHKISICKKEARESKFFITMIVYAEPSMREPAAILWKEANEINLIFNAIYRKIKEK
jgi:four helix bundle protein